MQIKTFIFTETNSKIRVMLIDDGLKSFRACAGDICAIWGFNEESIIKYLKSSNPDHVTSIWLETPNDTQGDSTTGKVENFLSGYLHHYLMVNINSRIRRRKSETSDEFNRRKELVGLFKQFYAHAGFYKAFNL